MAALRLLLLANLRLSRWTVYMAQRRAQRTLWVAGNLTISIAHSVVRFAG